MVNDMKYVGNDLTVSMNTDNVVQEFNKAVEEKRDYVKEELEGRPHLVEA